MSRFKKKSIISDNALLINLPSDELKVFLP